MKNIFYIIVLFSFLLLPSSVFAQTGTWSHELLRTKDRPWGLEALIKFERSPTGDKTFRILVFEDFAQLISDGPARVAKIKTRLELHYSPLNSFDIGKNSREIMRTLIIWIRNNPNATIGEAITAYDNAYPNAIWKGASFFIETQQWIIEYNDVETVTWAQFKTYVINNVFAGVDG